MIERWPHPAATAAEIEHDREEARQMIAARAELDDRRATRLARKVARAERHLVIVDDAGETFVVSPDGRRAARLDASGRESELHDECDLSRAAELVSLTDRAEIIEPTTRLRPLICPDCDGTGTIDHDSDELGFRSGGSRCDECRGSGVAWEQRA